MTNFIEQLAPIATKHGKAAGVLPSLILAQGILESASGTSELAVQANNLFGIKRGSGWTGDVYAKNSKEWSAEKGWYSAVSEFRKYPSYEGAVEDLVHKYTHGLDWEKHNRYAAVIGETDYKRAAQAIFAAGYATDPTYPEKLIKVIEQYNLSKYDEGVSEVSKILIALGHGRSKNGAWDPGARGNGTTEADWLRGPFLTSLKKYAGKEIDFYEQNLFGNREAATIKKYDDVIELHLDAASPAAKGGHVIIYGNYKPDAMDQRLGKVIEKHFGLRGGKMFDNRTNLHNLNTFAARKISYRLLELGFITNKANMDHFKKNYDTIAKELVAAILNETVKPAATEPKYYRVRKSWEDAASQYNAYVSFAVAKKAADDTGLNVYDASGKLVHSGRKKAEPKKEEKPVAKDEKNASAGKSLIKGQEWVKKIGISDGTYPNRPITRAEFWETLRRYDEQK